MTIEDQEAFVFSKIGKITKRKIMDGINSEDVKVLKEWGRLR